MNEQIAYYEQKLAYEIDSADLFEVVNRADNVVVIDARSADSFAKEHIPGAVNIPHRTMSAERTSQLDREALYVCYCDGIGCNASTKGALNLARLGFKVKELLGGLDWWKRDGYATQGSTPQKGFEIKCGC